MARVKVTKNVDTTQKFYISPYTTNCSVLYQTSAQDNSGNIYLDFVVKFNTSINASTDFTVGTMSDALLEAVKSSVFGNRNDGLYTADALILSKPSRLVFMRGSNQYNVIAQSDVAISPGWYMLVHTIIPALGVVQGGDSRHLRLRLPDSREDGGMMARKRLNDTLGFTDVYNDGYSVIRVNTQLRFGTFQLVEAQYNFTLQPWANGVADPNCFVAELPDEYIAVRRAEAILIGNDETFCVLCIGLTDCSHFEIRPLGKPLVAHTAVRAQLIWYF